jgi:glutaredoxin
MTQPEPVTKKLTRTLLSALNRADEIGGEVRDYIQDRVLKDQRYVALRRRIAGIRGEAYQSKAEGEAKAQKVQAAAAAVAAPVVAKAAKGLGDPGIKAQIYGKKSCPWTGRAITLLERDKVDYDFLDLEEPEHEQLHAPLIAETHQNTVPYVYLRGQFIGGFNALAEVIRLGQLEVALMTPEEKAAAPAHVRNVVIPARPNTDEVAPAETAGPAAD